MDRFTTPECIKIYQKCLQKWFSMKNASNIYCYGDFFSAKKISPCYKVHKKNKRPTPLECNGTNVSQEETLGCRSPARQEIVDFNEYLEIYQDCPVLTKF